MEIILNNRLVDGLLHDAGDLSVDFDLIDQSNFGEKPDWFADIESLQVVKDHAIRELDSVESAFLNCPESIALIERAVCSQLTDEILDRKGEEAFERWQEASME